MEEVIQKKESPQYPEEYENWSLADKEAFKELNEKLNKLGVKVEIVDAPMNLALYDEGEKTLKIRQDADMQFISDYAQNSVFKEQERVDDLDQNVDRSDYIHIGEEKEEANEIEPVLESKTEQTSEPKVELPSEPVATAQEESIPEWKKGKEWQDFEDARDNKAVWNVDYEKGQDNGQYFDAVENYRNSKKAVAEKIKESLRKEAGENLTPEQEAELKSKINDVLFEELVKKENDAYKAALKEARGETLKDRTLEGAKNLLGTKAVKWYLGLSRTQRLALSFGVGGIAGLALGAAAAPGIVGVASYLTWRAARVGISGTAGAIAGEWANKKWSSEELKKAEEKEKEDLKNSGLSLEEQSRGLFDIENKYKKERIKITLKKAGVTVAAGAGTGFATGLLEHAFVGTDGAIRTAAESHGGKGGGIEENRLGGRKGFEPEQTQKTNVTEQVSEQNTKPVQTESVQTEPTAPEKIFEEASVLKHEAAAGDSSWKILKGTLENNGEFKAMSEAQKTYVLSSMTNKLMQNPESYGLGKNGVPEVGKTVDLSKLFEDTKEVKNIFDKAKQTIAAGSAQEKLILENNVKINTWVKENPEANLTEDKVSDILNTKPKAEAVPETAAPENIEQLAPNPNDMKVYGTEHTGTAAPQDGVKIFGTEPEMKSLQPAPNPDDVKIHSTETSALSPHESVMESDELVAMKKNLDELMRAENDISNIKSPIPLNDQLPGAPKMKLDEWASKSKQMTATQWALDRKMSELKAVRFSDPGFNQKMASLNVEQNDLLKQMKELNEVFAKDVEPTLKAFKSAVSQVPPPADTPPIHETQVMQEIEQAKKRLSELEGPGRMRTMAGDMSVNHEVERAFRSEVDSIYGRSGFLGMGKIAGIDSKEWGEIARLPASKVVEYYTGDSSKSGLAPEIVERLSGSKAHSAFMKQTLTLMGDEGAKGAVKPFENENMEQFIKRLGGYVFKTHMNNAQLKAA